MHLGKSIIARILADRSAKPFLDAGLDAAWLQSEASDAIFEGITERAFAYLLQHADKHGRVPTVELFRREFPEPGFRLPDDPPLPGELIEVAHTEINRTVISLAQMRVQDILTRDDAVQGDRESVDDAAAVLAGAHEQLSQIAAPAGDFEFISFADLDDTPVTYWVDGLWARGGHMLFSGYGKVGKTSLAMYLLKGLTQTGEFLGRGCQQVTGRVVYVNLEMDEAMLRKYAEDAGLDLASKHLRVLQLRGKASQLRIRDAGFRRSFARQLQEQECEVLVIDTLSPLIQANQFDPDKEGRACLELAGEIAAGAHCDLSVLDHTGHDNKARARNDSGKQDWADCLWNVRAPREGEPERVLTAHGRGVSARLEYLMNGDGQLEQMPDLDDPRAGMPKPSAAEETQARRDVNITVMVSR